jgi:flagellar biosynthetic protein FliQ
MTQVIEVGRDLLYTALILTLPTLVVSLVIGLVISILQAATSVQEQTLSFAPRLVAVILALVLTLPWTLQLAVAFAMRMISHAAGVTR